MREALGRPPSGTVVYTFRHPGELDHAVPVFRESWDLWGAVKLTFDDATLAGYPVAGTTTIVCGPVGLYPERLRGGADPLGPSEGAPYGRAVFVDVRSRTAEWIGDRTACRDAAARLLR